MSRVFKASTVKIDESNRVFIDIMPAAGIEFYPDGGNDGLFEEAAQEPDSGEIAKEMVENARAEADGILEAAKKEADRLIESALAEANLQGSEIKKQAHEKGYEEGFQQGVNEAQAIKKEAAEIKDGADQYRQELIDSIEPEIVDLVSNITKKLLADEIEINPQVILILIRQGLMHASLTGDVNVHVSKEDFETAVANRNAILASLETMAKIEFLEDVTMHKGECLIETSFGSIDCGIGVQFEGLKKSLYYILKNR